MKNRDTQGVVLGPNSAARVGLLVPERKKSASGRPLTVANVNLHARTKVFQRARELVLTPAGTVVPFLFGNIMSV